MWWLFQVHRLYRTTDASFQKAQSEFTTGVLKNEGVRKAGAQLASDVATNAMSNNATASGNRYWHYHWPWPVRIPLVTCILVDTESDGSGYLLYVYV